jgi:YVTN family beta-propeller protein
MKRLATHFQQVLLRTLTALLVVGMIAPGLPLQQQNALAQTRAPQGQSILGDLVWHDLNGDGIWDAGEPGINGVFIRVWNDNGDGIFEPSTEGGPDTPFATATTSNNPSSPGDMGWYNIPITFGGPTYWVEITQANFEPGGPLEGFILTSESSIYPNPAYVVEGSSIATRLDFDFGFARADIELVKVAGNAPDGEVLSLPSGGGSVAFTYTYTNVGEVALRVDSIIDDNGTPNNPADDITVCTPNTVLLPGESGQCSINLVISQNHVNVAVVTATPVVEDFGGGFEEIPNVPPVTAEDDAVVNVATPVGSIGDRVWLDQNGNGIQNVGEPGIPGVTVRLLNSTGTQVLATVQTDGDGLYLFNNLQAGDYIVEFELPANFVFSPYKVGGNNNVDSDADPTTGRSPVISLGTGQNILTVDAGLYRPVSIGDRVWNDLNNNGIQDPGEPGLPGVTVTLFESGNPVPVATTTTDADGIYTFDNLPPGTYEIVFTRPDGFTFSPQNQGNDDALDSDPDSSGRTPPITLVSGQNITTVDAGLFQGATIGDFVWEDQNENGIQDPNEPGLNGVTVRLLDSNGNVLATTQTSNNGAYAFTNLVPGTYQVEFVLPNGFVFSPAQQGGNPALDSDADPNTGRTPLITLAAGETNNTIDAGMYAEVILPASLGDRVWEDLNGNGIQDAGEPGIPGVTVLLLDNNDNQIGSTTTDANGIYGFDNLNPGIYRVVFVAPNGYVFTQPNQGNNDLVDSDADPNTGRTDQIGLASGVNDMSVDAGLYRPVTIGDFVWDDLNADGIQDAGEPGIPGVTVQLFQVGNATPVATTTTDANGEYIFTNLPPGNYQLVFTPPSSDYIATPQNQGTDPAVDSNINTNGQTGTITLQSGDVNETIDAGYYQLITIGDFVWEDLNADGIQDPNEPGIPGVTVTLVDPDTGEVVATTQTDENGEYIFQVPPGTYQVVVTVPDGYEVSPPNQGNDDAVDSDIDENGETEPVTATSGEVIDTVDAGLYRLASLGDRVWNDLNRNGIQNGGEPGLANVVVQLFQAGGSTPIAQTQTNASGFYLFDNLVPGSYEVLFQLLNGYQFSPQNQGTNDALDSDADPSTGRTESIALASGETNLTVDAGMFLPLVPNPDYTIRKQVIPSANSADGIVVVGQEVSFSITVVNTGNTVLETIPLTDNYDPQFLAYITAVPAPSSVDTTNGVLTWNDITAFSGGSLAPGQSIVLGISFLANASTVNEPNQQTINVAIVSGAQDENGTELPVKDDDAPIRITNPAIGISKVTTSPADGIVAVGDEVVFTIQLQNLGDTTLVRIPVVDLYEANVLEYVSTNISAPTVTVSGNDGRLDWADVTTDLGDLPPASSVSFQVVFRLLVNQQTVNLAETGTAIDENGDPVPPVAGASDANVIPQAVNYTIFLPGVSNQEPGPTATPTPSPTPTPTPTPVPTVPGLGEQECPPSGCDVQGLSHPKSLGVHEGLQVLFLVSRDSQLLIKFDPVTNQVIGTAPTGSEPWDVIINEQTNRVYVTNFGGGGVWVYDAISMEIVNRIPVGSGPMISGFLPSLNTIAVVTRGNNGVTLIRDDQVISTLPTGGAGAFGLTVDPVKNRIFVSNRDGQNGRMYYYHNGSWLVAGDFRFGEGGERTVPFNMTYNPQNQKLYASYTISSGRWYVDIFRIDDSNRIIRTGRVQVESSGLSRDGDVGGVGLAVNPNSNHVYIVNTLAGSVSIIDGNADRLIAHVPVGPDPYDVTVNSVTNTVYVTLRSTNRLVKFVDFY